MTQTRPTHSTSGRKLFFMPKFHDSCLDLKLRMQPITTKALPNRNLSICQHPFKNDLQNYSAGFFLLFRLYFRRVVNIL
jgi:hypothetical protein